MASGWKPNSSARGCSDSAVGSGTSSQTSAPARSMTLLTSATSRSWELSFPCSYSLQVIIRRPSLSHAPGPRKQLQVGDHGAMVAGRTGRLRLPHPKRHDGGAARDQHVVDAGRGTV